MDNRLSLFFQIARLDLLAFSSPRGLPAIEEIPTANVLVHHPRRLHLLGEGHLLQPALQDRLHAPQLRVAIAALPRTLPRAARRRTSPPSASAPGTPAGPTRGAVRAPGSPSPLPPSSPPLSSPSPRAAPGATPPTRGAIAAGAPASSPPSPPPRSRARGKCGVPGGAPPR